MLNFGKMRYIVEFDGGATEEVQAGNDSCAIRLAYEVAMDNGLPKPYRLTRVDEDGEELKTIRIYD